MPLKYAHVRACSVTATGEEGACTCSRAAGQAGGSAVMLAPCSRVWPFAQRKKWMFWRSTAYSSVCSKVSSLWKASLAPSLLSGLPQVFPAGEAFPDPRMWCCSPALAAVSPASWFSKALIPVWHLVCCLLAGQAFLVVLSRTSPRESWEPAWALLCAVAVGCEQVAEHTNWSIPKSKMWIVTELPRWIISVHTGRSLV